MRVAIIGGDTPRARRNVPYVDAAKQSRPLSDNWMASYLRTVKLAENSEARFQPNKLSGLENRQQGIGKVDG